MLNIPPMGSLHENTQELLVFLIWLQHSFPRSGGMEGSEESCGIWGTAWVYLTRTCSAFLGRGSLELLSHSHSFPSHSWHKESVPAPRIFCCSPWDPEPCSRPGFHRTQRDQCSVLRGWESVNIWSSWPKSMELCQFRPSAEPGNFLRHLFSPFPPKNYTIFDFIFPRSFPATQCPSEAAGWAPALVQNTFHWCWDTEIQWFVAFPSQWKLQVNPGALGGSSQASSRCGSTRECPIPSSVPHTRASPAPAPGNPLLSNHPTGTTIKNPQKTTTGSLRPL